MNDNITLLNKLNDINKYSSEVTEYKNHNINNIIKPRLNNSYNINCINEIKSQNKIISEKLANAETTLLIKENNTSLVKHLSKFGKKEELLNTLKKKETYRNKVSLPIIKNKDEIELTNLLSEEDFSKYKKEDYKIIKKKVDNKDIDRITKRLVSNVNVEPNNEYDTINNGLINNIQLMNKYLNNQIIHNYNWVNEYEYEQYKIDNENKENNVKKKIKYNFNTNNNDGKIREELLANNLIGTDMMK